MVNVTCKCITIYWVWWHNLYLFWCSRLKKLKPIIVDPGLYLSEGTEMFYATQKRELPSAYHLFTGVFGSPCNVFGKLFVSYLYLIIESGPSDQSNIASHVLHKLCFGAWLKSLYLMHECKNLNRVISWYQIYNNFEIYMKIESWLLKFEKEMG